MLFAGGVAGTIDLAQVNGRVFVNNASLGLYAKIVQSPEYRDAKLRTAAAMLPIFWARMRRSPSCLQRRRRRGGHGRDGDPGLQQSVPARRVRRPRHA